MILLSFGLGGKKTTPGSLDVLYLQVLNLGRTFIAEKHIQKCITGFCYFISKMLVLIFKSSSLQ